MDVYLVVPESTNVRRTRAAPGWRVFVELGRAIHELEERFRSRDRSPLYCEGLVGMAKGSWPIPITAVVPNRSWLQGDLVNQDEPIVLRPIDGWRRVTQEDFIAWEIERQMVMGTRAFKWSYKKKWFPRLPSSEVPPRPAIITRR